MCDTTVIRIPQSYTFLFTHTHTHTHRIDIYPRTAAKPTNFLFRGNMPVVNGSFAYNEIVASMAKVAQAKNLTLPTNFTLIDVRSLVIHMIEYM